MAAGLQVIRTHDRKALARPLAKDPLAAAYLLADLEEPYFSHTQWFAALSGAETIDSLIMLYFALKTPALLTFGTPEGIECIARRARGSLPSSCQGMFAAEHGKSLEKTFQAASSRRMLRMGLEAADFHPFRKTQSECLAAILKKRDVPDLMNLMEHYPGNYFEPAMFREGFYFGIRIRGELVSAGGIHTCSPTFRVAAIGNIVTHRDYRRRGLALSCTSALVEMLLGQVDWVALNVEAVNEAAISCYRRLGFRVHLPYLEAHLIKRS